MKTTMEYNRYFWKSGRNQRERTAEEKQNIRRILAAAMWAVLAGIGVGVVVIVSSRVLCP